jgi:hypothetical protein
MWSRDREVRMPAALRRGGSVFRMQQVAKSRQSPPVLRSSF